MKRTIGILLTICFILGMPFMAFGATEYEVNLEKIDNIILYHSSHKTESDKVVKKIYSDYISSSLETSRLYAIYNTSKDTSDYDAYVSSSNNTWSLDYQVKITKLTEEKNLNNLILDGKRAYIDYFDSLKNKENVIKSLETNEKKYQILEKKYNKGLIALNELEEAREGLEDKEEEILKADEDIAEKLELLRVGLGIKEDDTMNLLPITSIEEGYKQAKEADYKTDLELVLKNSVEIKSAQLDVDRNEISPGKYSTEYKESVKKLAELKKTTEKNFYKKYKAMKANVKSIDKQSRKVSKSWKLYNNGKLKYDKDIISKNSLNELKENYYKVRDERNAAKAAMITEMISYNLVKKGF